MLGGSGLNAYRPTTKSISNLLFDADVARIAQHSEQYPFDVIVIGSGMGGGVLAHELCDLNQRTLLLERGDLLFTTHALNTTRPHADLSRKTGPTQDNDIVYGLLKDKVKVTEDSDSWAGGPLYCVGGRSNAWGLYIPRIDHKTLNEYFPPSVVEDLLDNDDHEEGNYYKRAEFLMHNKNYVHGDKINTEPLNTRERLIEQLNIVLQENQFSDNKHKELLGKILEGLNKHDEFDGEDVDVKPIANKLRQALKDYSQQNSDSVQLDELHWALLGAQFNSQALYEFPQGAFSTTDRILEAVFRTHKSSTSKMVPPFMTVLHNTSAVELVFDNDAVQKVKTVTATGLQHSFRGKKIVLCAGTLDSPALLLRSGIEIQPRPRATDEKAKGKEKDGKDSEGDVAVQIQRGAMPVAKYTGVTDHNIYGFRFTLKGGGNISAAKLQVEGEVAVRTPVQAGSGEKGDRMIPFLLNVCINAHSFLSREFKDQEEEDTSDGVCTLTYEFRAPINNKNFLALDVYTGQPILHIKNSGEETVAGGQINPQVAKSLSALNIYIEESIRKAASLGDSKSQLKDNMQWKAAGLGCVAHEIGTLPMSNDPAEGVVDANLKFHKFKNLYACDMSVLPVSAPANPSLTLVALALRLANHLTELGSKRLKNSQLGVSTDSQDTSQNVA